MIALEQLTSLKEYFQTAETIMVVVGPEPTEDQLAAASALYLTATAAGKEVGIYAPRKINTELFLGLENLGTDLGKQNLIVEFDYDEQAVDKVSYHINEDADKFYLTIKPQKGQPPLNAENVEFSYAGAEADMVFLVGVHDLETLDQLYFGYESLYENAFVVTLHSFQPELGTVQLDLSGTSSMSESLVGVLDGLELLLTEEAATNLLRGIEISTSALRSRAATAETFEVVARLMHSGAKRMSPIKEIAVATPSFTGRGRQAVKKRSVVVKRKKPVASKRSATKVSTKSAAKSVAKKTKSKVKKSSAKKSPKTTKAPSRSVRRKS